MDLRFPGQWFQLENGLAYNWHRHYDPTIGRYVEPDPLGLKALLSDGPSVYSYVTGNPLAKVDPDGLQASAVCVLGGLANPFCDAAILSDAAKICVGVGSMVGVGALSGDSGNCGDEYRRYLQNQVNSLCKPKPLRCREGDTCGSIRGRLSSFSACADARQKINNTCYDGGDRGHQIEYTSNRQEADICRGMLPTCLQ
jgi:RHS repeat-associated protein